MAGLLDFCRRRKPNRAIVRLDVAGVFDISMDHERLASSDFMIGGGEGTVAGEPDTTALITIETGPN